jgi:RND family efflux transporter MFP subunit
MKRIGMIFSVLAVGAALLIGLTRLPSDSDAQEKSRLPVDIAKRRNLESVVTATGEVLPIMSSFVKSEVSGRITQIFIDEGDAVTKGMHLLQLDRTNLEAKVKESARSLEAQRLRLEKSERNYERLAQLFAKAFVGEKEYLDAQTDFELAQLNLQIAQARLEDVEEDLSKTTIVAPHDGIVTKLNVVEGGVISGATSVSNGTNILTLAQMDELYMEASVNEVDVERLRLGQSARLKFAAMPTVALPGTIDRIAVSARKDGNIRVFPIEVVFEARDERVRSGVSATVEIPIARAEDVISVLLSAVFHEGDERYVFIQEPSGWRRQQVELGISNLQHVEIVAGVELGAVLGLRRPAEFRRVRYD